MTSEGVVIVTSNCLRNTNNDDSPSFRPMELEVRDELEVLRNSPKLPPYLRHVKAPGTHFLRITLPPYLHTVDTVVYLFFFYF